MPGVVTGARGVEVAERGALVEKRARGAEGAGCGVERGKVPEVWRVAERGAWSEERARGVEDAGCGAWRLPDHHLHLHLDLSLSLCRSLTLSSSHSCSLSLSPRRYMCWY